MMSEMLRFYVPGLPIPQGSKVCSCVKGRGSMREAAKGHKGARKRVTEAAKQAMSDNPKWGRIPKPLPVMIAVEFVYEAPASRKTWWGAWRTVAPDQDKLVRLVGDALKDAKVYDDDAQIAATFIIKHEVRLADIGRTSPEPGTYITISMLNGTVESFKTKHAWPI